MESGGRENTGVEGPGHPRGKVILGGGKGGEEGVEIVVVLVVEEDLEF